MQARSTSSSRIAAHSLAAVTLAALFLAQSGGLAPARASTPPVQSDPSPGDEGGAEGEGCGTWHASPSLADSGLSVVFGSFLDSKLLGGTPDWHRLQSQSPCTPAQSIWGRERFFREGSRQPLTTSHPDAVAHWKAMNWHARARIQAGGGPNSDSVFNQNDFLVINDTDTGAARRTWTRFADYAPPASGVAATSGQRIRFRANFTVDAQIVLDRRRPDCPGVQSACALADASAEAVLSIDGSWLNGAKGEEFKRVFETVERRHAKSHVKTQNFCTEGTVTQTTSSQIQFGLFYPTGAGLSWTYDRSRTVNAPLEDLYDSGLHKAPLKVEVEFCKTTTSTEPIQASISLVTDGSVFASINRGTWAEGVASAQLSMLEIDIFSGCIDCGSWQEPSPGPLPNP